MKEAKLYNNLQLSKLYSNLNIFTAVDEYNNKTKKKTDKAVYPLFIKTNENY